MKCVALSAVAPGARGEQGVATSSRRTLEALVAFIKAPTGAMPKLHPQPLDDAEVTAPSPRTC